MKQSQPVAKDSVLPMKEGTSRAQEARGARHYREGRRTNTLVFTPGRSTEEKWRHMPTLCFDMRMLNKAIQRERHPSPTVDDLVDALNGATRFET